MRSLCFRDRPGNRYWWHCMDGPSHVPPIYSFLSDDEWRIMEAWFSDTDKRFGLGTGECSIPAISILQGLIMGNGITRIVQCGHFIGYSTLLIGFMLRKMGVSKGLFSVDIDADVTEYTRDWIAQASLMDQVILHVSDSAATDLPLLATQLFGGAGVQLVFIDSSHQYQHTLVELDLWFHAMEPGGLLVLHDVSRFAAVFDATGQGGPLRALTEWCAAHGLSFLALNNFVQGGRPGQFVYADGCGLALIQKAPS